jgi:uncharacterized Zn-binding protein involved in type VI secretion
MKTINLLLLLCLTLSLGACKKDKTEGPESTQADANSLKLAEDNNDLKAEGDQANTDVTDALENFTSINGRKAATEANKIVCGCTIDSIGAKTIRLSYDGATPCGSPSRTRAGKITAQLIQGNRWANQGAVLKITFDQYTVTRLKDNVSWTFVGDKYYTNVNGTNWSRFLLSLDSLLFRERAKDLLILHGSGATTTYNIARITSWKKVKESNRDFIQLAALGDTSINGLQNVDTWGVSRFGKSFTNHYKTRWVSDTYCQIWRPRAGEIEHRSDGNTVNLIMGVNQEGNPSTLDCAYGWKLSWNLANGNSGSKIFSY